MQEGSLGLRGFKIAGPKPHQLTDLQMHVSSVQQSVCKYHDEVAVNIEEGTSGLRTHHTHSLRALPHCSPCECISGVCCTIHSSTSLGIPETKSTFIGIRCVVMKRTVDNVSTLGNDCTIDSFRFGIQVKAMTSTLQSSTILQNPTIVEVCYIPEDVKSGCGALSNQHLFKASSRATNFVLHSHTPSIPKARAL